MPGEQCAGVSPVPTPRPNTWSYQWIAASVILQSVSAALSKQAAIVSTGGPITSLVLNPWYAASLFALFLQALCWVLALRAFRLSFAYPFMSICFALNLLLAWFFFDEQVHWNHVLAILVIVAGVALMAHEAEAAA